MADDWAKKCKDCGRDFGPQLALHGIRRGKQCNPCRNGTGPAQKKTAAAPAVRKCGCEPDYCQLQVSMAGVSPAKAALCAVIEVKDLQAAASALKQFEEGRARAQATSDLYMLRSDHQDVIGQAEAMIKAFWKEVRRIIPEDCPGRPAYDAAEDALADRWNRLMESDDGAVS